MSNISISCSCCKGTQGRPLYTEMKSVYTQTSYTIVQCLNCTNGITFPSIAQNELNKIYSETYLYPIHLLALGEKKYRARAMAKYIRDLSPSATHRTVLEVGCMFGYLLQELKDEYKVKGIDIGEDAIRYCKEQGLDVRDTSIENFISSSDEKFDLIVISHVLEHLVQPGQVLMQLRKHLNPGGKIYILVPNYKSITANFFRRYWGWWQVPVHVNHFNVKSLTLLAENSGYKSQHIRLKGGDSLMLLLNFINLFSFPNKNKAPGRFQKLIIGTFTRIFRYWYLLGNEELTMVLEESKGTSTPTAN